MRRTRARRAEAAPAQPGADIDQVAGGAQAAVRGQAVQHALHPGARHRAVQAHDTLAAAQAPLALAISFTSGRCIVSDCRTCPRHCSASSALTSVGAARAPLWTASHGTAPWCAPPPPCRLRPCSPPCRMLTDFLRIPAAASPHQSEPEASVPATVTFVATLPGRARTCHAKAPSSAQRQALLVNRRPVHCSVVSVCMSWSGL